MSGIADWFNRNIGIFTALLVLIAAIGYLEVRLSKLSSDMNSSFVNVNTKLDSIETKVDYVRGYLKLSTEASDIETSSALQK